MYPEFFRKRTLHVQCSTGIPPFSYLLAGGAPLLHKPFTKKYNVTSL